MHFWDSPAPHATHSWVDRLGSAEAGLAANYFHLL